MSYCILCCNCQIQGISALVKATGFCGIGNKVVTVNIHKNCAAWNKTGVAKSEVK